MGLAAAGVGLASGLLQGSGARKQQKQQNAYAQQAAGQYDPQNIMSLMRGYNPHMYQAFMQGGGNSSNPFQNALHQMIQNPGYMDPQLTNQSLHLSAMRGNNDMANTMGQIGRNSMEGGMANMMPMMIQGGQTMRDMGTLNQFAQMREQLRRGDMGFATNLWQQMQGQAMQGAQGAAGHLASQGAPTPWSSIMGNAMQGGLAAYGTMGGGGGGGGGGNFGSQGFGMNPNWMQAPGNNGLWGGQNVTQGPSIFNPGATGLNSQLGQQKSAGPQPQAPLQGAGQRPKANNTGVGSNVSLRN